MRKVWKNWEYLDKRREVCVGIFKSSPTKKDCYKQKSNQLVFVSYRYRARNQSKGDLGKILERTNHEAWLITGTDYLER